MYARYIPNPGYFAVLDFSWPVLKNFTVWIPRCRRCRSNLHSTYLTRYRASSLLSTTYHLGMFLTCAVRLFLVHITAAFMDSEAITRRRSTDDSHQAQRAQWKLTVLPKAFARAEISGYQTSSPRPTIPPVACIKAFWPSTWRSSETCFLLVTRDEKFEDCDVVSLPDAPEDIFHLLRALHFRR